MCDEDLMSRTSLWNQFLRQGRAKISSILCFNKTFVQVMVRKTNHSICMTPIKYEPVLVKWGGIIPVVFTYVKIETETSLRCTAWRSLWIEPDKNFNESEYQSLFKTHNFVRAGILSEHVPRIRPNHTDLVLMGSSEVGWCRLLLQTGSLWLGLATRNDSSLCESIGTRDTVSRSKYRGWRMYTEQRSHSRC